MQVVNHNSNNVICRYPYYYTDCGVASICWQCRKGRDPPKSIRIITLLHCNRLVRLNFDSKGGNDDDYEDDSPGVH